MKHNVNTLLACLIAGILMGISCFSFAGTTSHTLTSAGQDIVIQPRPSGLTGSPRSPLFNPFLARQDGNTVLLGSTRSCGKVEVTMTSTAGDDYCIDFYTENGTILLPISGEAGHYTMILVTEIGLAFEGEFNL
ncbi:MAG: hypothetical protein J5669_01120 [Bacteroidales bacterium]|nr:hypothetical protein [Bacteroidales bacterium]